VAIEHRFHFFRMHLQPSHVHRSVPAAHKVITSVAQFQCVARIHKTFGILDRRSVVIQIAERGVLLSYPQRVAFHLHLHVGTGINEFGRKAHRAVLHFERHPGLR